MKGKKNGKIKEYSEDGKLIFEGEYSNGVKNGKCREYNYSIFYNYLRFEGNI